MDWNFYVSSEFDGNENECYKFHKQCGTLETDFFPNKPGNLTQRQLMLINAFYSARRETDNEQPIKSSDIESHLSDACYPVVDLGVKAIQKIDNFYMRLCSDKIARERKQAQARAKNG